MRDVGDLNVREKTLILEVESDWLDVDRRDDAEPAIVLTTTLGATCDSRAAAVWLG